MDDFEKGFREELEKIGVFWWVAPAAGFAAYDVAKAGKEQLGGGPRPEETLRKSYLTKYPSLGLVAPFQVPAWAVGKGLEALGRRGDTGLHRAASMGAAGMGAFQQMDPLVALQKGLDL